MNSQGPTRFHRHHGTNISLDAERVSAVRCTSFANAITFSEKPLAPGEIFLIEIEENETGWSGNMRIGLTQMNPNKGFEIPQYALPDLVSMERPSWLYAITKTQNNVYNAQSHRLGEELSETIRDAQELIGGWGEDGHRPEVIPERAEAAQNNEDDEISAEEEDEEHMLEEALFSYRRHPKVIQREGSLVRTPRGFIQLKALLPRIPNAKENMSIEDGLNLLATDIGSRIGVMYVPTSENKADMHFIINGEDQGPCAKDIPYQSGPLFAVVDVYGSTKRVRVVQLHEVESLQSMCRDVILRSIRLSGISNLPLPKLLKDYLCYL